MQINGNNLILLPVEHTKYNALTGFWRWVEFLAADDYERAIEGLYWRGNPVFTPEKLKERIGGFFGGKDKWVPVIPNQRLIDEINGMSDYAPRNKEGWSWIMAQIPVTTRPDDPKDDKIPLMGIAASFYIRSHNGSTVLDFEIFHA